MRTVRSLLFICISLGMSYAENDINADPDLVGSGFEFNGATAIKIGDYLQLKFLETGGFLQVRDEKCFNCKFLPTHNWRGFFFCYANLTTEDTEQKKIVISLGYEHESAHPTMGIKKATTNAFEKIYDDVYRNINLNSFTARYSRYHLFERSLVLGKFDYQFYFKANNTPELPGNTSSVGHGLSLGIEYIREINNVLSLSVSVFDRYIFKGQKEKTAMVYFGKGADFEQRQTAYPIINEMNTFSVRTSLLFNIPKIKRHIAVYGSFLYGNIFGFVDSREKRMQGACGVSISQ